MTNMHTQSEAFMRNSGMPFKCPALIQKPRNKVDLMPWVKPTSLHNTLPLRRVVFTPRRVVHPHR